MTLTSRRTWIGACLGAIFTRATLSAGPRRFGRLTTQGWYFHRARTGRELHVLVDGHDVTRECVLADDRRGYAVLNLRDERGRIYIDARGKIARRIVKGGHVQIIEREASNDLNIVMRPRTTRAFTGEKRA